MSFIDLMLALILGMFFGGLFGALVGLIPFFVGRVAGKPNLGKLGWKWCTGLGLAFGVLAIPVSVAFVVAVIVKDTDYYPKATGPVIPAAPPAPPVGPPAPVVNTHLGVSCLTGPLKGQTYAIGASGMIIGRDHDCTIRFDPNTSGISRHHCSLRWQNGVLVLTDLGSPYGTFLADGRKLPPQYPTQLAAGSRFYLANQTYMFQIVITG